MKEAGRLQAKVIKLYVDMRLKRISKTQWLEETQQKISSLLQMEHTDRIPELFQVQLWLTKGELDKVEELMESIAEWLRANSGQSPICHAYYLYLTALMKEDAAYDERVTEKLKELAQKNPFLWQIEWLLFYADNTMSDPLEQYHFVKKMYLKGCRSPLMYLEARALLERNPTFLYEFSEFEIQTAVFMIRHAGMSNRICEILQEHMLQRTDYRYIYLILLWGCYDIMPSKHLLEAICRIMVLGSCTGENFGKWYRKGIQEGVHTAGIYEAYMKSLPVEQWYFEEDQLSEERNIPREVLEYFAHDCSLDDARTAYLYAFIHKYQDNRSCIYQTYEPLIMPFIMDSLYAGRINAGLAYLYENVLSVTDIPKECAERFLDICHTCRITGISAETGVLEVCYEHADIVTQAAVCGHEAMAVLYGENYCLLMQDCEGRMLDTGDFKVTAMMKPEKCLTFLETHTVKNKLYYMSLVEKAMQENDIEACADAVKHIWTQEQIQLEWKAQAADLVLPYWDINGIHDEILRAEPYVFVREGCYDVQKEDLFWKEQYLNNKIGIYGIRFLMEHHEGSLHELAGIFTKAGILGIENSSFAQRLLMSMMHTGQLLSQYTQIFEVYCGGSTDLAFMQEFLEFAAKESYMQSAKMSLDIIKWQAKLTKEGSVFSVCAMLAFLYSLTEAGVGNCTQECAETAAEYIKVLLEQNIYFGWLQPLKAICPMLEEKEELTVLEYKGECSGPVWVRYAKYTDSAQPPQGFESEVMDMVCDGVYAKNFVLFFGERVRYEILMLEGTQQNLLKQGILQRGQDVQNIAITKFARINHMLFLREKREEQQLHKELEDYYRQSALVEQLYTLR